MNQKQRLDRDCCSADAHISEDGRSVTIGTGTVLCAEAWDSGIHAWSFTARSVGWHSFCGVATRDPGDVHEVQSGHALSNLEGGWAIAGWGQGAGNFPAFHAGEEVAEDSAVPLFQQGERIRLVLDLSNKEEGLLRYFRNGVLQAELFRGKLFCGIGYAPAFSGTGLVSEFAEIAFED